MAGGRAPAGVVAHRFAVADDVCSLVIDLPGLSSLEGVELDIGDSEVRLRLPGDAASQLISLPAGASGGEAVAKFSKKRSQLTLTMPSISTPSAGASTQARNSAASSTGAAAEVAEDRPAAASAAHSPCNPGSELAGTGERPQGQSSAYGSVWNTNSWHWEEKNCLDIARLAVQQLLAAECRDGGGLRHVRQLGGVSIELSAVELRGEASFSLRRGKRILCFELSLSFKWEALDEFDGRLGVKGTGKAPSLTQDEDEPEIQIEISVHSHRGQEAKVAGGWMKQQGAAILAKQLAGSLVSSAIIAAEEARSDADADRKRRSAEKEVAEVARETGAEERARIAAEERTKEQIRRTQAALTKSTEAGVQGSVWNVNAWHWEERPMTDWSRKWLERELADLRVPLLAGLGTLSLAEPSINGDASVSIRKGKPIVLFQLNVSCRWKVVPDVEGIIGEAKGIISAPEFTSEDNVERTSIEVEVSQDGSRGRFGSAVRQEGVRAIRAVLSRFVADLRAQLPQSG